jgi:hypothetical protein
MEDHRSAPRVSAWGCSLAVLCLLIVAVIPSAACGVPTAPTFVSFVSPDNDGAGWFQNPVGCGIASGADHQTVGGGAFAPGLVGVGYPDPSTTARRRSRPRSAR